MIWLFYGGTYLFATYFVIANPQDYDFYYTQYVFSFITASYLALDALLLISGILSAYLFLNMNQTPWNYFKSYFSRYFRFMAIILTIMFTAYVPLGRLIQGPISDMYFWEFSGCSKYWFTNILMISNFYPSDYNMKCMWWS